MLRHRFTEKLKCLWQRFARTKFFLCILILYKLKPNRKMECMLGRRMVLSSVPGKTDTSVLFLTLPDSLRDLAWVIYVNFSKVGASSAFQRSWPLPAPTQPKAAQHIWKAGCLFRWLNLDVNASISTSKFEILDLVSWRQTCPSSTAVELPWQWNQCGLLV